MRTSKDASAPGAKRPGVIAAVLLGVAVFAGTRLDRLKAPKFPPLSALQGGPFVFQDAALAVTGFRAAAADLAWIQLLQYSAGGVPELPDRPGHPYEHLGPLSLRTARLDPSFHRAVLFGASILAWFHGVERPDEAAELLHEGMRAAPEQRLFPLYLAALAYKKQGDQAKMIALMESSMDSPDTPAQMKAILANVYESRGDKARAAATWKRILANERDASEHARAKLKLRELGAR